VPANTVDSKSGALPVAGRLPARGSNARRGARPGGDLPGAVSDAAAAKQVAALASTPSRGGKAWGPSGKSRRRADAPVPFSVPSPGPGVTGQIQQLKEMGFSEEQSREALAECVWDVNKALDLLFTRWAAAGNSPRAAAVGADGGAADDSDPVDANAGIMGPAATESEKVEVAGDSATENSTTASTACSPRSPKGADMAEKSLAATPTCPSSPLSPVDSEAAVGGAGVGKSSPRKRIERVEWQWDAEDPSQMSVVEGDFVLIWVDTASDNGWIYAERHSGAAQAGVGWLPVWVLQELPQHRRWMRTTQHWEASDESQCSVEEGAYVMVWSNSKTSAGWTYVEGPSDRQPGWLPIFCLEWTDE